jgi:energy-coupling factor transport system ATP-binding protein
MGNTVILVSHSMEDVAKLCNKVVVMNKGKLAMYGTVDEIYSRGEELKSMGLNVPEITDIFLKLKASGVNCKTNIYTVEQGVEEYRRLMREVQDYD